MSQPMTIERVTAEDQWSNDYGTNQAYSLDLRMPDGTLEMGVTSNRKLKGDGSHNEPKEGEAIWGDILQDGRGGEKLKLDYDAMKNNGGSSSRPQSAPTGSSESKASSGKGETDWEVRNAEIRRQHSQEMGLRYATLVATDGPVALGTIADYADYFDDDAIAAGRRAVQGASSPVAGTTEAQATSPAGSAPPEQPSADVTVTEVEQALDTAGLTDGRSRNAVSTWMLSELPDERIVKAVQNLTNPTLELQAPTLKALRENTEKALGGPLPVEDFDGEDPPF